MEGTKERTNEANGDGDDDNENDDNKVDDG